MAILDSRKVVVAAKYGATATSTDVVAISNEDVRLSPEVATGSFRCINGKLGNKTTWKNTDDVAVSGASIECYLTGNDATGSALDTLPNWTELYKVCGLTETVNALTGVVYTPSQTQPSDLSTVTVWRDGFKRTLTGVVGTLTVSGSVGEPIKQTVAVSGFTTLTSTAEANPTAACIDDELLLVLKSIDTITVGGSAVKAQSFTLTQGNDNQKLYAIGTKDFERVDFDASLELVFYKENETIYTTFENGTQVEVVIKAGATDGKACRIKATQAIVESITEGSNQMKETVTVKFNLQGDVNGVNQFKLEYGDLTP